MDHDFIGGGFIRSIEIVRLEPWTSNILATLSSTRPQGKQSMFDGDHVREVCIGPRGNCA
jgi:hypothetical protein